MPGDIALRALQETDVQAVYEVAVEAWHSTYKDIYPAEFINTFVHEHYAPAVSLRLVPRVQAGHQFFQVALVQSSVVGFCHIAETRHGMESATSGKAGGLKKVEPLKAVDVVNRSKRFGCEPPTGGPAYHRSI
jgi:hypothetical protein